MFLSGERKLTLALFQFRAIFLRFVLIYTKARINGGRGHTEFW